MLGPDDQDSCSLCVRTLANIPAEEIFTHRHGGRAAFVTLMDAMLLDNQEQDRQLRNLWDTLCDIMSNLNITRRDNAGATSQNQPQQATVEGVVGDNTSSYENALSRRDRRIPVIVTGIAIIAAKGEKARAAAERKGRVAHRLFVQSVEQLLQLEYSCIYSANGQQREILRSFTHTLCLQYLMNTGDARRQELMFDLLKKFFLGFSRYELDGCGARPIHYALSLCGGVNEERFINEIINPLFDAEEERFRATCSSSSSLAEALKDQHGNSPIHYALNSVYCSESTIRCLLSRAGYTYRTGDPLLSRELVANIPYYAFFYSLDKDCERFRDTFREAHVELRSGLEHWRAATSMRNMGGVVEALHKHRINSEEVRVRVQNFGDTFYKVLKMLCAEDMKIGDDPTVQSGVVEEALGECLSYYKYRLGRVRHGADTDSDLLDCVMHKYVSELFDFRGREHKYLGARLVVREFIDSVLSNGTYIRRVSICAHYARTQGQQPGGYGVQEDSDEWRYDEKHTVVVHGFFALTCLMCKLSSRFCHSHLTTCEGFRQARDVYHRDQRALEICRYLFPSIGTAVFWGVLFRIILASDDRPDIKIWKGFISFWAITLVCVVSYVYCDHERSNIQRMLAELELALRNYISGAAHDSGEASGGANEGVDNAALDAELCNIVVTHPRGDSRSNEVTYV
ncbi:MAG: hypothetical protein ACTJLK_00970 [Anaplasma sp.]